MVWKKNLIFYCLIQWYLLKHYWIDTITGKKTCYSFIENTSIKTNALKILPSTLSRNIQYFQKVILPMLKENKNEFLAKKEKRGITNIFTFRLLI